MGGSRVPLWSADGVLGLFALATMYAGADPAPTPAPNPGYPTNSGYWLVAADGGVFAYGNAAFLGSAAGDLHAPAVGMTVTFGDNGYWIVTNDGTVLTYADAPGLGQAVGMTPWASLRAFWGASAGRLGPRRVICRREE